MRVRIALQLVNISTQQVITETNPAPHSNEAHDGNVVVWQDVGLYNDINVKWCKVTPFAFLSPIDVVKDDPLNAGSPDIVNSFPCPFVSWTWEDEGAD